MSKKNNSTSFRVLLFTLLAIIAPPAGPAFADGAHFASPEMAADALADPRPQVRAEAARTLGYPQTEIQGSTEPQALTNLLLDRLKKGEPAPQVRRAIYWALGQRPGAKNQAKALPVLAKALQSEPNQNARSMIAEALGQFPNGLPPLIKAIGREKSLLVQTELVKSLSGYGPGPASKALTRLLLRPSSSLRISALKALGATGDSQAAPQVLALLKKARNPLERNAAVRTLGLLGNHKAIAPLAALISGQAGPRTSSPAFRREVAQALSLLGSAKTDRLLPPADRITLESTFLNRLDDTDLKMVMTALDGLGRLKFLEKSTDRLIAKKIQALYTKRVRPGGKDNPLRLSLGAKALQVMMERKPAEGLPLFIQVAGMKVKAGMPHGEGWQTLRRSAVMALGFTGSGKAWKYVGEKVIKDSDPRMRAVGVFALWRLAEKFPGSGKKILPLLKDKNPEVRRISVVALSRLQTPAAKKHFRRMARKDPHPLVQKAAREALKAMP